VSWSARTEEKAELLLAGAPPAFSTMEREYLAAAVPEIQRLRLRLVAAERELAAAQRAAADLARAHAYDGRPSPTSTSYGLSCAATLAQETPA